MKNYSIIREIEYNKISKLNLNGNILDIGGSKRSGYHDLISGEHTMTTVNINASYGCDLVFDVQEVFPLKDNSFDNVLCFNVLEHIYKYENVFDECSRVLKSGGKFISATPFMHHVHGSPDDYFRYTKSSLELLLQENEFENIEIEEMGYGLFSLIFQVVGGAIPTNFLRAIFKNLSIFIDKFFLKISSKYRVLTKRIPLGYFVIATRK